MADRIDPAGDVAQTRREARAPAEVRVEALDDLVFVLEQHGLEPLETIDPNRRVGKAVCAKRFLLPVEDFSDSPFHG